MNKENLVKGLEKLQKVLADPVKLAEWFDKSFDYFDKDKSGTIERSELKKFVDYAAEKIGFTAPAEDSLASAIKAVDVDGSGSIDKTEFAAACGKLLAGVQEALTKAIAALSDGAGEVIEAATGN